MIKYYTKKKGTIGIGTLILFITMILITAIVTSVLVDISNLLQQRTSHIGKESTDKVTSGITILEIRGYHDGSKIKYMAILITPNVGSVPIDLNQTVVILSAGKEEIVARYNESKDIYISINEPIFDPTILNKLDDRTFGIAVIRDIDSSCQKKTPVINKGDIVAIILNTTKLNLEPETTVSGTVQPEVGIPAIISFTTPTIYLNEVKIIQLQ